MSKKTTVLVADDEALLRERLLALLSGLPDIEVLGAARNGLEAMEKIVAIRPQIVVTDIVMPGMDGIELATRCRERGSEAQFILLSGYQDFQFARRAIQCGVVSYLLKPISRQELVDTLTQISVRLDFPTRVANPLAAKKYSSTVRQILEEVENSFADSGISLKKICQTQLFVNETYAGRIFHREIGMKFSDYVNERRIKQAVAIMHDDPSIPVSQIADAVGFGGNYRYFIEIFKKNYDNTPKQYQLLLR